MDEMTELRNLLCSSLEHMGKAEAARVETLLKRLEKTRGMQENKYNRAIQDRQAVHSLLKKTSDDLVQRYRTIFEHSGSPMVVIEKDGTIVLANAHFCALTGQAAFEIEKKANITDYLAGEASDPIFDGFTGALPDPIGVGTTSGRIHMPDGTVRDVMISMGSFTGSTQRSVTFLDVTERNRLERELVDSETYLLTLMESIRVGVLVIDAGTHTITDANPATLSMIGAKSREDVIGKSCHQFVCPGEAGACPITDLGLRIENAERDLLTLDGNKVPIIKHVVSITLGEKKYLLETFVDNSERKMMEEELRETTDLLSGILKASPVGFHKTDTEGKIVYINDTWLKITGFTREEALGRYYADLVHPDDREQLIRAVQAGAGKMEGMAVDTRIIRPDGTVRWISAHAVPLIGPVKDVVGWVGAIRDITEVRGAEDTLRKSEARFRDLADLLPQIIFEMDTRGFLTYCNAFAQEVFGITDEMLKSGVNTFSVMVPEDRERAMKNLQLNISGKRRVPYIYTLVTKDGGRMTVYLHVGPIVRDGDLVGFRGSTSDITELKRAEEALSESREKYRMLAENTPDIHFSADVHGSLTYVSPQIRQYGFTEEEVMGRSIFSFVFPADRQDAVRRFDADIHERSNASSVFRILDKEGDIHWVEQKTTLVPDAEGNPHKMYGILREITERKKAEAAIELANRKLNLMNNITRHDILNTITGIFGCVDMLHASGVDPENDQLLADIKDQVRVIQRQITFTKEYQEVGIRMPRWQNVHAIIRKVLRNFDKPPLSFPVDIGELEVYADPLFEKVIYNLVDNAVRYAESATRVSFFREKSGKTLILVCDDDGTGVAADQKEHIFERGIGRNTGMGLFLTREILEITGISISETGIPGKGARFEIRIPQGGYR